MPHRILLIAAAADGDPLVRRLRIDDWEPVVAATWEDGLGRLDAGGIVAVIVSAERMGGDCGRLLGEIRQRAGRPIPVLLLTRTGSLESCRGCPLLSGGNLDCADLPVDPEVVTSRLARLLGSDVPIPSPPTPGTLSPREREVLELLREGLTNPEIARRLFISEKVVEKHVAHLCAKLGVANRTEAVALSYRRSILASRPR